MQNELHELGTSCHVPTGGPALDMVPWGAQVYPKISHHPSKTLRQKTSTRGKATGVKSADRKTGLR